ARIQEPPRIRSSRSWRRCRQCFSLCSVKNLFCRIQFSQSKSRNSHCDALITLRLGKSCFASFIIYIAAQDGSFLPFVIRDAEKRNSSTPTSEMWTLNQK